MRNPPRPSATSISPTSSPPQGRRPGHSYGYQGAGVVRFVGVIDTQRTHEKFRVGFELDKPEGKNDGAVDGQRYFQCLDKHGVLAAFKRVKLLARGESRTISPPNDYGFRAPEPTNDVEQP